MGPEGVHSLPVKSGFFGGGPSSCLPPPSPSAWPTLVKIVSRLIVPCSSSGVVALSRARRHAARGLRASRPSWRLDQAMSCRRGDLRPKAGGGKHRELWSAAPLGSRGHYACGPRANSTAQDRMCRPATCSGPSPASAREALLPSTRAAYPEPRNDLLCLRVVGRCSCGPCCRPGHVLRPRRAGAPTECSTSRIAVAEDLDDLRPCSYQLHVTATIPSRRSRPR